MYLNTDKNNTCTDTASKKEVIWVQKKNFLLRFALPRDSTN